VARQNKFWRFCNPAGKTRRNIIARGMSVDDFDVFLADEFHDFLRAQNSERISQRNMQNVFRWYKIQPRLPLVGRAERDKNFVSAIRQTPAQINKMFFAAAKVFCRTNLQNFHTFMVNIKQQNGK